ncbi:MAG: ketopantoate reductase C-terminal domain-containing protein [Bacteroidota bacterium]
MVHVGILGLGAIGHLIAAQLWEKSGLHLHFYNRTERRYLRFKNHLSQLLDTPINCQTTPAPQRLDWLFICLKTYHYPDAAVWFQHLIGSHTRIAVLRNGLAHSTPLLDYTDQSKILPILVDGPTQYNSQGGYYHQLASARLIVLKHPLSSPLQSLLNKSHLQIQIAEDFITASWAKLIESAAIGAISCLTGETCHIFQQQAVQQLYKQLLEEGIAVAKADGAQLPNDYSSIILQKLAGYPPEKGSSMLTDRLAGRPIEVMAKSGIISQKGKELGVSTPLHDNYTVLLQQINRH